MTFQHLQGGIIAMTILVWGRLAVGTFQHFATVRVPQPAPASVGVVGCSDRPIAP